MAFDFDGVDDSISYGSATPLDALAVGGAFSVHAWIKPDTTGENGTGRVFNKRESESAGGWILFMSGTAALRGTTVSSAAAILADSTSVSNSISLGVWHSVVMTYDDAGDRKIRIYVDGVEVSYATQTAAAAANGTDAAGNMLLGNNNVGTRTFDGTMQEVGVWNRVLAAHEISALAKGFSIKFFGRGALILSGLSRGCNDWKGNSCSVTGATAVPNYPGIIRPAAPNVR